MNPGTITLVRHSWQQARGLGPQVGALFYQQLFAADPTLRPLFRGDMDQQSTRLLQMIGAAVDRLDDLDTLQPVLLHLGQRHAGYGVQPGHYPTVGAALLATLQQGLGADCTPAVQAAWAEVYGVLSGVMLAGAARPADA